MEDALSVVVQRCPAPLLERLQQLGRALHSLGEQRAGLALLRLARLGGTWSVLHAPPASGTVVVATANQKQTFSVKDAGHPPLGLWVSLGLHMGLHTIAVRVSISSFCLL